MFFQSTHNLEFLVAPWITQDFTRFKIGTVNGIWTSTKNTYDILGIDNDCPGNGHFDDVFEWFENSCKRDKKDFRFLEVWNERLRKHLTEKRGFVLESKKGPNYIKKTQNNCLIHELEDLSIERRIHFGLQLMAFTRSLVKDEKAAVKIVQRSFEKLYDAERKFTFVNDETVSTYLRLSAKTLADYYLKTFI